MVVVGRLVPVLALALVQVLVQVLVLVQVQLLVQVLVPVQGRWRAYQLEGRYELCSILDHSKSSTGFGSQVCRLDPLVQPCLCKTVDKYELMQVQVYELAAFTSEMYA